MKPLLIISILFIVFACNKAESEAPKTVIKYTVDCDTCYITFVENNKVPRGKYVRGYFEHQYDYVKGDPNPGLTISESVNNYSVVFANIYLNNKLVMDKYGYVDSAHHLYITYDLPK
jgi:hypothetical protein